MPKAVFLVYSEPSSSEREDEYNDWYDNTHLREVCETPGVTAARRFKLDGEGPAGMPDYLAVYEFDADDPAGVFGEIGRRSMTGEIHMSDAIKLDPPPVTALYVER